MECLLISSCDWGGDVLISFVSLLLASRTCLSAPVYPHAFSQESASPEVLLGSMRQGEAHTITINFSHFLFKKNISGSIYCILFFISKVQTGLHSAGQRAETKIERRRASVPLVVAPCRWWDRCLLFCVHAASRRHHGFPFPLGNLLALPAKKSVLLCSLCLSL